jgi:hypothetical protein
MGRRDQWIQRGWTCGAAVCLWLVVAGGCGGSAEKRTSRASIQSESASERILAIRAAGEARDRKAVPLLVDRLEDEDDAVRFFAILALEKTTGERFGYDYARPANERARSVERWRAYAREAGRGATGKAGVGGGSVPGGSATGEPSEGHGGEIR